MNTGYIKGLTFENRNRPKCNYRYIPRTGLCNRQKHTPPNNRSYNAPNIACSIKLQQTHSSYKYTHYIMSSIVMSVNSATIGTTPAERKLVTHQLTSEESIDQFRASLGNLILEDSESVTNVRNVYRQYKLLENEKTGMKLFLIDRLGLYYEGNFKFKSFLSYTLDDYGLTYFIAMFMVTIAFLWNVYMIPFRWAFVHGTIIPTNNFTVTQNRIPNSPLYYLGDILADTIYIFDIILIQSHKQYTSHAQGVKITDIKQTIKFYISSYGFYLDVAAIIFPLATGIAVFCYKPVSPYFPYNSLSEIPPV